MKKYFLMSASIFVVIFSSLFPVTKQFSSAVACKYSVGRFGDQLLSYCVAKLISYKTGLPLLYSSPAGLSEKHKGHFLDELVLSREELQLEDYKNAFKKMVDLSQWQTIEPNANMLYMIKFNFKLDGFGIDNSMVNNIKHGQLRINEKKVLALLAMKKDKNFLAILRKMISPIHPIDDVFRPKDKITVALHVRTGGGFDRTLQSTLNNKKSAGSGAKRGGYSDVGLPIKFPPDSFYVKQIKKIYKMLDHKPLYVHVFTDDDDSQHIVDLYKQVLPDLDVTFATRTDGNAHDQNVLEDFFAMAKFDCLIRPASGFSEIAQVIGDHKIVISPNKYHWEGKKLVIDSVWIDVDGQRS